MPPGLAQHTGNKLHLLRASPALVAWRQQGHKKAPQSCSWLLSVVSQCLLYPLSSHQDESGTAAPAGELALRNVCGCWPAVFVQIFPEKEPSLSLLALC